MKNNKKALVGAGILALALLATGASANEGTLKTRNDFSGKPQMRDTMMARPEMGDQKKTPINMDTIKLALTNGDYAAFNKILVDGGIKETVTEAQFKIMVEAYTKAKAGDIAGAQKIIIDAKLDPMLHRFIMGQNLQLTDDQKTALKNAEALMRQGKTDEARALIVAAGLPDMPQIQAPSAEVKAALEKAKILRDEGKTDEAKQVLKDAGISGKAEINLKHEFEENNNQKPKITFVQKIKNFFRFGKK